MTKQQKKEAVQTDIFDFIPTSREARERRSLATGIDFTGTVSRAKQADKDATDINRIMARYHRDGIIDHVAKYAPRYADLSTAPTYLEAMQRIQEADEMFMSLPASIRSEFSNSPSQFLDFVTNPKNAEKMQQMGLLAKNEPAAQPVPTADTSTVGA